MEELFKLLTDMNASAVMDALEELALRPDVDQNLVQKLYDEVSERQYAMAAAGL